MFVCVFLLFCVCVFVCVSVSVSVWVWMGECVYVYDSFSVFLVHNSAWYKIRARQQLCENLSAQKFSNLVKKCENIVFIIRVLRF